MVTLIWAVGWTRWHPEVHSNPRCSESMILLPSGSCLNSAYLAANIDEHLCLVSVSIFPVNWEIHNVSASSARVSSVIWDTLGYLKHPHCAERNDRRPVIDFLLAGNQMQILLNISSSGSLITCWGKLISGIKQPTYYKSLH